MYRKKFSIFGKYAARTNILDVVLTIKIFLIAIV